MTSLTTSASIELPSYIADADGGRQGDGSAYDMAALAVRQWTAMAAKQICGCRIWNLIVWISTECHAGSATFRSNSVGRDFVHEAPLGRVFSGS